MALQRSKRTIGKIGNRILHIMICLLMVFQTLFVPRSTLAASAFYFRGFNEENVTSNTFAYATSDASVSGRTVTVSPDSGEGMAVGLINLNETGYDISESVDLGGLEIDFSTLTTVSQEGADGAENDVPTVDIDFCSSSDIGSSFSSVHLAKSDLTVSGDVTLSSGARIPTGTRSIFITLTGKSTTGSNTVVFSNISLVVHDSSAPSCSADYNTDWTNEDVTVTITAADDDAGLEGIYLNDAFVSASSPYTFVVSSNDTSFTAYAKDLAGKQSDTVSETVDNIDKNTPGAPTSLPLSSSDWSNTNVTVLMPVLGESSGSPERYVYQTGTSAWADLPDECVILANGYATIVPSSDGLSVLVTPNANYNGPVSFSYTIADALNAESNSADVSLTVQQVNDAPETENDTATTEEDLAVEIDVLSNDSDVDMKLLLNAHPEDESIGVVITGVGLVKPGYGTIETDGTTITYTPNEDYNGTDTFDYYCSDGEAQTKGTVTVTITQVNDSPIAKPDTVTTQEDTATDYIDVMANDTDVDTDPELKLNQNELLLRSKFELSSAWLTDTSVGTIDRTDNKIKFTPTTNWSGTATIFYTLQDGYGASCDTTLTVTVEPVNDLPVFDTAPDNMLLTEDGANGTTTLVVSDIETAAASLAVTVIDSSNKAMIDLTDVTVTAGTGGSRTITVNPNDNQNGEALITLQVDDLTEGKRTITFTVTVSAVNDDPVADDRTMNIAEDAPEQLIPKSSVAHDVDIATNADALTLTITTAAQHGTAQTDASGNITYTPDEDFNGTDWFVYTATDLDNAYDTGTVTVNVSQVNDAPVTKNDTATTEEDLAVEIDVLSNDSDVDMKLALNAHPEDESIGVLITGVGLVKPSHGTIETDGATITYKPNKDYNGTDTFDYYCSDGEAQTKGTVTVTITQVNDSPIAVEDSGSTAEDVPVSVDVLSNDTDVDTIAALNQGTLHDEADFYIESCYIFGTAHGTVEKNGANIDYDPAENFYGTQTIKYVLNDGHGQTSIGTLTIEVGSENDRPIAVDDTMRAEEDRKASVNVLDNDTDVDIGDTKTFAGFTEPTSGLPGSFVTNENGDVEFTPNDNYNGTFSIRYQMKDSGNLTSIATLTVTIDPLNDAPTAGSASVTTDEDNAKDTDVSSLIDDVDILTNADALNVTVTSAGEPLHGTVSVLGTVITYTPDANYNGLDEIVYTVTDKAGEKANGTLSITVNPVNDSPVARNDEKTTQEDQPVEIFARMNDSDIDTNTDLNQSPALAPVIDSVTNGLHGKAVTDGATITYTPDENYNGTDEIRYVLTDGALTSEATISITITQVNDKIQAKDDTADTNDEETVRIDVLANDTDVDTDPACNQNVLHSEDDFLLTEVGVPEHGTAKIVTGEIEYTPEDRFSGTDRFPYTVSDGHGSITTAWVTVTVHSVNDAPKIIVVSKPEEGDQAGTGSKITVEWTGFDIDGDVLTYKLDYYDGTSWHQIADNLLGTSYLFSVPDSLASTDGLKFRVNARDSEYTSDYGYSGAVSVDKDAPAGTIVTMRTADGRTYSAGSWTNQTVSVVASNAVDASKVTYNYALDDGASAAGSGMDVTTGVHTVHITATDEYGNSTSVGSYLVRVDKQRPAEPETSESVSGGTVVLAFALHADPGGSGNRQITMPDGSVVNVADQTTFAVTENGVYSFTLTDVAGNRRVFTYTVSMVDTSKPTITLDSGNYSVGNKTQDPIHAKLTFADAQSEITSRGYQISKSSTASGTYRVYSTTLVLEDPGTYYIDSLFSSLFKLDLISVSVKLITKVCAA